MRAAEIKRTTKETDIAISLDIDGNGKQISKNKKLYSDFIKIK